MLKRLDATLKSEVDPGFSGRARFIFEQLEASKPQRILDAGCGRGFYTSAAALYPFIKEIHGIDVNEAYLKKARNASHDKRINLQKASIYHLPYPNGYFDFIIASEIFEHLDDDAAALKELQRILKKGGTLVASVPHIDFPFLWDPVNWVLMRLFKTHVNKNIWWLAGIWADHERLYSRKQFRTLFTNAGMQVKSMKGLIRHCWPFSHFILYGIGKNLVERLNMKSFSRFNFDEDKQAGKLLASIVGFPSRMLDRNDEPRAMNLLIAAEA